MLELAAAVLVAVIAVACAIRQEEPRARIVVIILALLLVAGFASPLFYPSCSAGATKSVENGITFCTSTISMKR